MGIVDRILASPAIVRAAAAASGIQAIRLEIHGGAAFLVVLRRHGDNTYCQIVNLPIGKNYTIEQILETLFESNKTPAEATADDPLPAEHTTSPP